MDKADGRRNAPDFDEIWEDRIKGNDEVTELVETIKTIIHSNNKGMSDEEVDEMAIQSAYDDMNARYDEIVNILYSLGNEIIVYREICVEDYKEFLSGLNECSNVGVYWSIDKDHAISYWGHHDDGVVLVGHVDRSEIDFEKTIISFVENQEEYEIRLKEDASVFISDAIIRRGCGDRFGKTEIDRVAIGKHVLS